MYLNQIGYKPEIVKNKNNSVNFQANPRISLTGNTSGQVHNMFNPVTGKKTFFSILTAIGTYFIGHKIKQNNTAEEEPSRNTAEQIKATNNEEIAGNPNAQDAKTWEMIFSQIEEKENARYNAVVEEAKKQRDAKINAAQAERKKAKTDAQEEYDAFCIETIGKKCDDVIAEARYIYISSKSGYTSMLEQAKDKYICSYEGHTSVIEQAKNTYIYSYEGHTSVVEQARDKYIRSYEGATSIMEVARQRYDKGEITETEYKASCAQAEAEYAKIEQEAIAKYEEIKAQAEADFAEIKQEAQGKFADIKSRAKALSKKHKQMSEDADTKYQLAVEDAKQEYNSTVKAAKQELDATLALYAKLRTTHTGELPQDMTFSDAKRSLKQKVKKMIEEKRLQEMNAQKQKEKVERRNAAAKEELEQAGYTNVKELKNGGLSFEYQNITYRIKKDSEQNDNLYQSLLKAVKYGSLPKGIQISAVVQNKVYACDWLFNSEKRTTESLYKFLYSNQDFLAIPEYKQIIEDRLNKMDDEELYTTINNYRGLSTKTDKGQQYLEELKTKNPARYIKIMTPAALFKTTEGQEYLKIHDLKAYKEAKREEAYAKIERIVDEQIPPASTIRISDFNITTHSEPHYDNGYWDYETAPNGSPILSSRHWVSGSYYPGYHYGTLTYEYNGKSYTIHEEGNYISEDIMLKPIREQINADRRALRNQLIAKSDEDM